MNKKVKHYAARAVIILILSVLVTVASYGIVTKKNVQLDSLQKYVMITGRPIVNLPCLPAEPDNYYPNWDSAEPILPEARGIPFNYHFWNPCYGHQILRNGLILNIIFWAAVSTAAYGLYGYYRIKLHAKK